MNDFLFGRVEAYTHNGDAKLLASLGLRTTDFGREWTDLGTVEIYPRATENGYNALTGPCPATTVKVEVVAYPAQFWRFTVTRPRDEVMDDEHAPYGFRAVYEPVQVYEISTGSGSFSGYWPAVKLIAEHMLEIKRLDSADAAP